MKIKFAFTLFTMLAAAVFAGCEGTKKASPLITEYDKGQTTAELDFWHGLAEQPITTNNDAMHGLIELANESDPATSYEERLAWLKEHNLLSKGFNRPADEAVKRGTVAQVICRILDIDDKGGMTMRIIGAHPRYATRELVYLEIMRRGTSQQALSGIQFVGIIGKAQDFNGRVP